MSSPNKESQRSDSDSSITAVDYIQKQSELEKEARELMPYEPDKCTYEMGELRQSIYACLTCSKENDEIPIGICYSCSIHCHSQHELVELFTKRSFVCDCGTTRMSKTPDGACKLRRQAGDADLGDRRNLSSVPSISAATNSQRRHSSLVQLEAEDIPSSSNVYNQNFHGRFCGCKLLYNPLEETGNMLQCYFGFECGEDWYHDQCIMGFAPDTFKTKENTDGLTEAGENMLDKLSPAGLTAEQKEYAFEGAPKDTFVDTENTIQNSGESEGNEVDKTFEEKKEEGTNNKEKEQEQEQEQEQEKEQEDIDDQEMIKKLKYFPPLSSFDQFICWQCVAKFAAIFNELEKLVPQIVHAKLPRFEGVKTVEEWHELAQKDNEPMRKRVKLESPPNTATTENEYAGDTQNLSSLFLSNDFKEKLKKVIPKIDKDSKLAQFLHNNSFLYDEDPIYEPPMDLSEEEWSTTVSYLDMSAADAMHSLPRKQAIETIQGYDKMRAKLREFFKPFAEQGKVVTEEEVKSFFGTINNGDTK